MEDMGNTPSREASACGHPAIGSQDKTQSATATDQYAARHNPFVYFHSLLDSGACARNDVPLTALTNDLSSIGTTPNLSYITPNLCDDGHDSPCANGKPGGLASANAWLQTWVPRILNSPAFKKDGLLVVTFDESDGPQADATACCGETAGPNTPASRHHRSRGRAGRRRAGLALDQARVDDGAAVQPLLIAAPRSRT